VEHVISTLFGSHYRNRDQPVIARANGGTGSPSSVLAGPAERVCPLPAPHRPAPPRPGPLPARCSSGPVVTGPAFHRAAGCASRWPHMPLQTLGFAAGGCPGLLSCFQAVVFPGPGQGFRVSPVQHAKSEHRPARRLMIEAPVGAGNSRHRRPLCRWKIPTRGWVFGIRGHAGTGEARRADIPHAQRQTGGPGRM
jgi:hypothetical protein